MILSLPLVAYLQLLQNKGKVRKLLWIGDQDDLSRHRE
jgi:hypothetical protein